MLSAVVFLLWVLDVAEAPLLYAVFPEKEQPIPTLKPSIGAVQRNAWAGNSWRSAVDTGAGETNVIISEIMYHAAPEMDEDTRQEWIELHNRGTQPANLHGWQLTRGINYTFPHTTLPAGGRLIVAADVMVFKSRYPQVTQVVGDWIGTLSNNGEEIQLRNAVGNLINSVTYGSQGDWANRLRGRGERQIASLTPHGALVTAFVFGHNFSSGDWVRIYGAEPPAYNGVYSITVTSSSTFSFTLTEAPAAPAAGVIICRQLTDQGANRRGWGWSALADGLGRSMELVNENLSNQSGQNWAASATLFGTPGAANSTARTNVAPMILGVQHLPRVPLSTEAVTVSARLLDEHLPGLTAAVYYRNASTAAPPAFTQALMWDDGEHGDGAAGDGIYGATLPAQTNLAIVEFYVEAVDAEGNRRTWPAAALDPDDNPLQQANALYQVDDSDHTGNQPIYRLILTEAERAELRLNHDQAPSSDATMNATFITRDGVESTGLYLAGVHNRGAGTRVAWPMNYRVSFPNDRRWQGKRGIHLNSQFTFSQLAGYALGNRSLTDVEASRAVRLLVNGANLAYEDVSKTKGSYIQLEDIDSDYASSHFPLDDAGNLYSASKFPWDANLDYWGSDPATYQGQAGKGYYKGSNVSENHWDDLIELCNVLNNAPEAGYAQAVRRVVNVEQWMRNLAFFQLVGSGETSLQIGVGDDYLLYRGVHDPRFLLLSHDLDTVLGQGSGPASWDRAIFNMVPAVRPSANTHFFDRFMRHPELVPAFYRALNDLLNTTFRPDQVSRTLDEVLGDWAPDVLVSMKQWATNRYDWVRTQIPLNLSINHPLPLVNGYPRSSTPTILLSGVANAIDTRKVLVNGEPAEWTAWLAVWTNNAVALRPGLNGILVQACDAGGREIDRRILEVVYDRGVENRVSGTLPGDATWAAANGPYHATGNVGVPAGVTLTIEPGTTLYLDSGVDLTINGRLLAEASPTAPIRFTRVPGSTGAWGGITINGGPGTPETRLAFVHLEHNGSTAIHSSGGTVFLDHLTFGTSLHQYLSLDGSSFVVQDCVFPSPSPSFEPVHGTGGIKSGGHGLFLRNFFGAPTGDNDVINFTGGSRPGGPIVQVINNVFTGSGDDLLDLDGADAWVEGNLFLHAHKNGSRDLSSAVSGGQASDQTSEITLLGNLFYDCDHAVLAKEGSFFTLLQNTIVRQTRTGGTDTDGAVVSLADAGAAEGAGVYLEGNIIHEAEKLVRNHVAAKVTLIRNLLPFTWSGPGNRNSTNPPLLKYVPQLSETVFTNWAQAQVMRDWFSLAPGSPALGTGPNARDQGAVIPRGVSIRGEPEGVTNRPSATLTVGVNRVGAGIPTSGFPEGAGYTRYRWRLDGGEWSPEIPLAMPISLTGLENGRHQVEAVGRNDAGLYQNDSVLGPDAVVTASRTWIVDTNHLSPSPALGLRLNEVLAGNQRAVDVGGGKYPDLVELYNSGPLPVDLNGMSLTDQQDDPRQFVFPPGAVMNPGQYLVLLADNDTASPGIHLGFNLNQESDALYLFATNGWLVDSVSFGPQIPDLSIGRLADGDWTLAQPTFGTANIAVPLGDPHAVKINEWLAAGDSPFNNDFIELINFDSRPVNLTGWFLTDNPIGAARLSEIAPHSFIAAGGFVVILADGLPAKGPTHANFRLAADRGVIALLDRQEVLIDFILYGPQTRNYSQGRSPNGADLLAFFASPTPGAPNLAPVPPGGLQLVINEILARNTSGLTNLDGATPAWIELYNPTPLPVSLAELSLSDDLSAPRKFVFPADVFVPSGGYRVVWCEASQPASTTDSPFLNCGFKIRANGGAVYLFNRLTVGGSLLDGISYGLQASDYSIGRVPTGSTNWILNLPTPAGPNSAVALGDRRQLKINEWMADPVTGSDWFEIFNPNTLPVDLSGLFLTDDLSTPASRMKFRIAPLSFIGAGFHGFERFWADDAAQNSPDHCNFALKASGESLGLSAPGEVRIDTVSFGLQGLGVSQGRLPDGAGTIVQFPVTPTPDAANYLPSPNVVINEVLSAVPAHSALEQAVELHNPTGSPVNLGGWFLSNQKQTLPKYRFPDGLVLPGGGFLVVYQNRFNPDPRDPAALVLDALHGDTVQLAEADAKARLTGYRAVASFGAAEAGVSLGRYVNSAGVANFVPMSRRTFGVDEPGSVEEFRMGTGLSNADPQVGPIVITEIRYHPPDLAGADNVRDEFIELCNCSGREVPLYDPFHSTNTWRLSEAVTFRFPTGVTLRSGECLLVVGFDPVKDSPALAAFRAAYGLATNVVILGPYAGKLDNGGEAIVVCKPGPPQPVGQPEAGYVPYHLVERVEFDDASPWEAAADGTGRSLQRRALLAFGNDPANWYAGLPTAGWTAIALDRDGDQMPDDWELAHGLDPNNPLDADLDTDGDGMKNRDEYRFGCDPRDRNSVLALQVVAVLKPGANHFPAAVLQFQGVIGKSYTIEFADLVPGAWAGLTNLNSVPATGTLRVTNEFSPSVTRRFYRIPLY